MSFYPTEPLALVLIPNKDHPDEHEQIDTVCIMYAWRYSDKKSVQTSLLVLKPSASHKAHKIISIMISSVIKFSAKVNLQ